MRSTVLAVIVSVICAALFSQTNGHGMLLDPPSRNSRMKLNGLPGYEKCDTGRTNYDHMAMFCGGRGTQTANGGLCSACGENVAWSYPRPHDYTGDFATRITPGRVYLQGQTITVKVDLTAPHRGKFQFRICNLLESDELNDALTTCFNNDQNQDNYRLHLTDGSDTYTGPRAELDNTAKGINEIKLKLPNSLTCPHGCSFQWRYIAGNNNGPDNTQEHFVNCADIIIVSCRDYVAYRDGDDSLLAPFCGYGPTHELKDCDPFAAPPDYQEQNQDGQTQTQGGQDQNQGGQDTDCDEEPGSSASNGGSQQQMPPYGNSGQGNSMSYAESNICDECEGLATCQHDDCEQTYVGNSNTIDSYCAINCNKSPPVCPPEFCRMAWVPKKNYRQIRILSLLHELLEKGSVDGRDVGAKPYRK